MRDILFVSRWFYTGGASILEWLAVCTLAAVAAVAISRFVSGAGKRIVATGGSALCVAGGLICAAMILAEILVFEFTVPLAAAAYAVLAVSFACLFSQLWTAPLIRAMCVESVLLAIIAFGYLFFYGAVPPIIELRAGAPDRQGMNVLGDRPGTLAIAEFADFECPPCAVQDAIMDKIWAAYSDRITYSFRHFPKARHPHAEPAAVVSQCAAESGAFWETKRLLFSNQDRLAQILARPELPTIPAREAKRFGQCVQARATQWSVARDRESAANLGLRVTPSIIVGDKLIEGVIRYPRLALIVERELRERNMTVARQTTVRAPSGCGVGPSVRSCSE
jgi:protein-disulfide isomerase